MRQTDILIVGGGLAGSLAAAMLGRKGLATILVDPHDGEAVLPSTAIASDLDQGGHLAGALGDGRLRREGLRTGGVRLRRPHLKQVPAAWAIGASRKLRQRFSPPASPQIEAQSHS